MADLPNVGDVAQVVRTCECGFGRDLLDLIVRVVGLGAPGEHFGRCIHCKTIFPAVQRADIETSSLAGSLPREWLRRYRPLSELESIDIADELDAERKREQVNA